MTFRDLCEKLTSMGVPEPENEAFLMLDAYYGASRASILTHPEREYDPAASAAALEKRRKRIPLAYILGQWHFYEETYFVDENCLIPRPETELLVSEAIRLLPPGACFADLCTGSGCVAVSTLCHRPDTRAVAVDLFPRTLALAAKNAAENGVSERFEPVLADVLTLKNLPGAPFDALVSNPPYIPARVVPGLAPEVQCEPHAALDGGQDGLDFYRAILGVSDALLKPEGLILFEIGYDQKEAMAALAAAGGYSARILQDLGGQPRVAILKKIH